ncbi:hypothetical protein EVAR_82855_1 [Eumeta japonica]|uniref:Uncharacterized protein n=1 Tax=Eumeta variegata TaxID=151549 RepID=A0A4C1V3T1_EUMVA|nr:hypothetical protein EVAR_82855_1 [Eumeta japonica]
MLLGLKGGQNFTVRRGEFRGRRPRGRAARGGARNSFYPLPSLGTVQGRSSGRRRGRRSRENLAPRKSENIYIFLSASLSGPAARTGTGPNASCFIHGVLQTT